MDTFKQQIEQSGDSWTFVGFNTAAELEAITQSSNFSYFFGALLFRDRPSY